MPLYTYKNPETDEHKDVLQSMNDKHVYEEGGVQWLRVFYSPNMSIDTQVDPFSSKDFKEKACTKRGSVGDLLDQSKELSQKRIDSAGFDAVKEKTDREYSAARGGRKPLENVIKEISI